jgi:hypothetical protein
LSFLLINLETHQDYVDLPCSLDSRNWNPVHIALLALTSHIGIWPLSPKRWQSLG